MNCQQLEKYLHEHIPLSAQLGVRVRTCAPEGVRLAAPLAPNLNHRRTAFGGSLSAVAILAAWSLLHVRLSARDDGAHRIVIHSNAIDYLAPVRTDFEAFCPAPPQERWDRFEKTLERRGRARIELAVELHADGHPVARFRGRYVAMRNRDSTGLPSAFQAR